MKWIQMSKCEKNLHQNKQPAANFGEKDEFVTNLADFSNSCFFGAVP